MPKRKAKSKPEAPAPPAKKARYEPKKIYTVTYTHFIDDYKARGSDWSDYETLGTFCSRRRAVACADAKTLELVKEELENEDSQDEELAQYFVHDKDGQRRLNEELIKEDLYLLEDRWSEGEYVPRKYSVDVIETALDDRASDVESE